VTPDARDALVRAGFSRRSFLKGAGALIVGFSAAAVVEPFAGSVLSAQGPFGSQNRAIAARVDSWLAVAADGRVTAFTGKCDLGQGMFTAQLQLVAEELDVAIDRIHLIQCDTARTPDEGTTSGSQSTPTNFNHENLAQAAATAREALVGMAAKQWGVPADRLHVKNGVISDAQHPSKKIGYGELLGGRRFDLALNPQAKRKPQREWTVLGTSVGRVDLPALATGTFEFVHNVRVPGMLHGQVVRPPTVGATLVNVDERSVRDLPGFVKLVVRKNFVGIVCEKPWQALQAAAKVKATWKPGPPLPAQASFYEYLRHQPSRDSLTVDSGDVEPTLGGAAAVLKATYHYPYQMHGSMGSSCAVADVQGDTATVWSPTQSAYPTRSGVAMLLGLKPEQVHVIFTRGSGCYGLNGADTVSYDAALLSQAAGKPVRIQLTRKDEMAWENYGYAYVLDQRAGVDANGQIVAWESETWSPTRGGRPGYNRPGNVVTGLLAGFEPSPFEPQAARAPEGRFRNGSNAAPSYVAGCVGGACGGAGTIKSERVLSHTIDSPFFTGPLRSPSRLQNTFAHESFMDELAAHVKADPVAYRLKHLSDPRLVDVVKAAAKQANWQPRPSPNPARPRTGIAHGRGLACVAYEGDNGYAAIVVEVSVDQTTGTIAVTKLAIGIDAGPISNPNGLRNQAEGGALHGMSRALGEEVTWDEGKVTSIDWRTYHSLPVGFAVPAIDTVLINRTGVEATGAGETTITLSAAAIANAIFDATGARLREAPFTAARVKAALAARA
jgi:CO/xanthine dehydrogenase Mo-binding subunit